MYVLTIQRGESVELLACSTDIDKLHTRINDEVLSFISEVYGDDEEAFEWLMPISDGMTFWSDEDEEYCTTFRIESVEEI